MHIKGTCKTHRNTTPKGLTQPSNFRHFLPCMVSLYNILCGTILEAATPTVSPVIGRPVE